MDILELEADVRKNVGKGAARVLRREKKIPAILYGPKTEPLMLSVGVRDLDNIIKKSQIAQLLVTLVIRNGEEMTRFAMLKELQTHPVSQSFLHADFYEISMDQKIRVPVPIVATGKAKGVELGGILQIIRREVEVICLPQEIPETIAVDVSDLGIGDSIHIDEIPLEGNIEIPQTDVNFTVITVVGAKVEETPAEEEEEEGDEEVVEEEKTAE